eukprot:193886-Rhodomonas_salina.2
MEVTLSSSSSQMSAIDMEVLEAIAEVKAAYAARARKQQSSSLLSSRDQEVSSIDREIARRDASTDTEFLLSVSRYASETEGMLPIKDLEEGTHDAEMWSSRAWTLPPHIPVHSQHPPSRPPPGGSVDNQVEQYRDTHPHSAPRYPPAASVENQVEHISQYRDTHPHSARTYPSSRSVENPVEHMSMQWRSDSSASTNEARAYMEAAKARTRKQFAQSEQTSKKWKTPNVWSSQQDAQRDWQSTLRSSWKVPTDRRMASPRRPRSAGQPRTPHTRGKSTASGLGNQSMLSRKSDYIHALELHKLKSYPGTFGAAETGRLLQQSFSGWLGAIVNTDGGPASYEASGSLAP